MFKIYLSRAVSPGAGISLPATIEEIQIYASGCQSIVFENEYEMEEHVACLFYYADRLEQERIHL